MKYTTKPDCILLTKRMWEQTVQFYLYTSFLPFVLQSLHRQIKKRERRERLKTSSTVVAQIEEGNELLSNYWSWEKYVAQICQLYLLNLTT